LPDIDIHIVRHDARPAWPDLNEEPNLYVASDSWGLAAIEGGMESGAHSVALRLTLPGLGTCLAQTSLAAWIAATCALRGAFPEAFAGGPLADG
jgi:hypothetical protein